MGRGDARLVVTPDNLWVGKLNPWVQSSAFIFISGGNFSLKTNLADQIAEDQGPSELECQYEKAGRRC